MPNHSFLLYVEDPLKSAAFYEKLLRAPPVEVSPGYAMFALTAPTMLGLWKRADVLPKVTSPTGSNEVGFHVESNEIVEQFFESAKKIVEQFCRNPHRWILATLSLWQTQMGIACGCLPHLWLSGSNNSS